ncbi:MAG: patatin-like phospholipase family protein [Pseudomonadota bacterium]|nr:patatin-like phospholipase family protein [Pseudomonadota bacterium]
MRQSDSAPLSALVAAFMLLLFVCCMPLQSMAAESGQGSHSARPKIGLALSGGGARGAAHVGVLRVLEELHIPIDYIAGTSMGAIVGGLYASGMSPNEIEKILVEMDWDTVMRDAQMRPDRSFRRKLDDRLYLSKLKAGVKDGKLGIPTALVQGQKFNLVLNRLTVDVAQVTDFDRLPIPFRAVATEIATGKEVVLGSGNLATAIRASFSVPGVFAGVKYDGKLLVDGGISNNLPVSVVREMGADIVIAIDISTPLLTREQLTSALKMAEQLSGLLTRRNTEHQIASLTNRDVLIVPPLGKLVTSASFGKVSLAIEIGEKAAREQQDRLRRLSLAGAKYSRSMAKEQVAESRRTASDGRWAKPENIESSAEAGIEAVPGSGRMIDFIRFENDSKLSNELLANLLGIREGESLNLDRLEEGIGRIYGQGIFESVTYELVYDNGEDGIIIKARKKSWGTDFLQFGLAVSVDTNAGDSRFNIGAAYTKMPLNDRNGEWRTGFQFGEDPGIFTEIYQPLGYDGKYFVNGRLAYRRTNYRLFEDGVALSNYNVTTASIDLATGMNLGYWGEIRGGYRGEIGDVEILTGLNDLQDYDFNNGELYLRFSADKLDSVIFPRNGYLMWLEGVLSRESLGSDEDFEQLGFQSIGAKSWGKNTFLGRISYNTTIGDDAPLQNMFQLGGFLNLSGLQQNQLSGQHAAFANLGYQRQFYKSRLFQAYVGASLESGNAWMDSSDILSDTITAGSLFLGLDNAIAPLYFGYGIADTGDSSFYLFMGNPWF